jgi:hypothetical protein
VLGPAPSPFVERDGLTGTAQAVASGTGLSASLYLRLGRHRQTTVPTGRRPAGCYGSAGHRRRTKDDAPRPHLGARGERRSAPTLGDEEAIHDGSTWKASPPRDRLQRMTAWSNADGGHGKLPVGGH